MAPMIILWLVPLALGSKDVQSSTELQVMQPLWQEVSPNGIVNIPCKCSEKDTVDLDLQIRLLKTSDGQWSCSANSKTSSDCSVWQEGRGSTVFILSHQNPNRHDMYVCECTRIHPVPIITQRGTGTILVPELHCPILNIWTWTLIGVAGLFCLCFLLLACVCIKLRVLQSEETDDSVTYEQMQRKRQDPDSNAEYVDMREVYSVGSRSRRDMNYNSQHFHPMLYASQ